MTDPTPPPSRPTALDLDALEREGGTAPVFDFMHAGRRWMLSDPQEVDWQQLILAMSNPVRFLQMVLPPEQHDDFFSTPMATWKMNTLMDRYLKHYGLPAPGELSGSSR